MQLAARQARSPACCAPAPADTSCLLLTPRRLHPGVAGLLPANVDVEAGVRGTRPRTHPPQSAVKLGGLESGFFSRFSGGQNFFHISPRRAERKRRMPVASRARSAPTPLRTTRLSLTWTPAVSLQPRLALSLTPRLCTPCHLCASATLARPHRRPQRLLLAARTLVAFPVAPTGRHGRGARCQGQLCRRRQRRLSCSYHTGCPAQPQADASAAGGREQRCYITAKALDSIRAQESKSFVHIPVTLLPNVRVLAPHRASKHRVKNNAPRAARRCTDMLQEKKNRRGTP